MSDPKIEPKKAEGKIVREGKKNPTGCTRG